MKKLRHWTLGLTLVGLLVAGVVALAGNGFGGSGQAASCSQSATTLYERDADGDGIPNCDDPDWTAQPADGSGYGTGQGYRMNQSESRPLDGTGRGMHRAGTCGGGCS